MKGEMNGIKEVFTTGEVARISGLAVSTVVRLVDTGVLPGFKVPHSKHRRIRRKSLVRFFASNPDMPHERY